ncbi:MAG: YraN family protein [Prevotella sp.]|nr:YraN family protein [Prevotella sp.]
MSKHNETGQWGEQQAVAYLQKKGYVIRDRNWRSGHREIDIVALAEDLRTLVFVEVKTRSDIHLTTPDQAVDRQKIRNIGYAANSYVKQFRLTNDLRFDIITVVGTTGHPNPVIEHWEDAFNPMLAY